MADSALEHAREIFKTALEKKELNRWQSDMRRIAGLVKDTTLLTLLEDTKVSIDEKAKVLSERLIEVNTEALKLVSELMSKNRLPLVTEIADEYQQLLDNYHGIEGAEVAEITTAIEIDDEYQLKIAQRLTSLVGKPVILKSKVDSGIVGGIIIKIGDKLIDGSIRSKLAALKKELDSAAR
ncbi:ATP synthase F1 subunit delta [Chloroflexota bacterium]